jgi:hypothetical protein
MDLLGLHDATHTPKILPSISSDNDKISSTIVRRLGDEETAARTLELEFIVVQSTGR